VTEPRGRLYLVPAGLGPAPWPQTLPDAARTIACGIQHFVVENAKAARAELKRLDHPVPLRALDLQELPERPRAEQLDALLQPAMAGRDIGLMSDAGCPAVADPGALLVARAHQADIRVVPLVGPSSILLALMASGMNGQSFTFHGYLPAEEHARDRQIAALEAESRREGRTQIFIETPYRNQRLLAALLERCHPHTRLCVARDLTTDDEWIRSQPVAVWRKAAQADLARRPAIFLLLAA
jgi:16S rRNA (cytidine1402-2'-O)-methyltransferase